MAGAPSDVQWRSSSQLLVTRLASGMSRQDAAVWSNAVSETVDRVPDGTRFVWLADASSYRALATGDVHPAVREVVPRMLAAHGLRTVLASLYDSGELDAALVRGVRCRAVAHVHGDSEKMGLFDEQLRSPVERFFSDLAKAEGWVATFQPDVGRVDEPVTLEPYGETWGHWFQHDRDELLAKLGAAIEEAVHIGSTAVPGMLAKPIVDVMLSASRWPLDSREVRVIEGLGYEHLGECGVVGHECFRRRTSHATNLAVVERNSAIWSRNLELKALLIGSPDARAAYRRAKEQAWASGARSLLSYSESKRAEIERLMSLTLAPR